MSRKKTEDLGWVYLIDQGEIGLQPYRKTLAAGEADLKALAGRLEIPGVHSLTAEMTLQRIPGNKAVIHVEGILKADVTQSCIISHAPVKEHIEEEFEAWYADPASFTSFAKAKHERAGKLADAEIPVMEESEAPEPMVNGKIDLGDLVAQYLSLSLNPYPRAHGVAWDKESVDNAGEAKPASPLRKNPFEALKDWKSGDKGKEG
ncbi:MAG: YceD family protein [Micavibrio sp.]